MLCYNSNVVFIANHVPSLDMASCELATHTIHITTMNRANIYATTMLFPMVNSEIAKYYPTNYHITCEVRIRVSKDFVNTYPVLISPMFINTVKGRSWLTTVYDVVWQENMIYVMNQQFTLHLSQLQLVAETYNIVKSKNRINMLRSNINNITK